MHLEQQQKIESWHLASPESSFESIFELQIREIRESGVKGENAAPGH